MHVVIRVVIKLLPPLNFQTIALDPCLSKYNRSALWRVISRTAVFFSTALSRFDFSTASKLYSIGITVIIQCSYKALSSNRTGRTTQAIFASVLNLPNTIEEKSIVVCNNAGDVYNTAHVKRYTIICYNPNVIKRLEVIQSDFLTPIKGTHTSHLYTLFTGTWIFKNFL